MGSPITFSGFNQIDFNLILNAIMEQERTPVRTLEIQKRALDSHRAAFATLAAKLTALESAATELSAAQAFQSRQATISDTSALSLSAAASSATGVYDVVVNELARAQVTATNSPHGDRDETIVATGGTLTIGGVAVTLGSAVTLKGLADAINGTDGLPVTATIISAAPGSYQLVLTGKETGESQAFTVVNQLTGGVGISFPDADQDGISGNSPEDNARNATNAILVINGLTVVSASNVVEDAIAGASITLLKKDPDKTITVSVAQDSEALRAVLSKFLDAYNDLLRFAHDQSAAARRSDANSIGRDPLLRGLRQALQEGLTRFYGNGSFEYLAAVGVGFTRTGELSLDRATFDAAAKTNLDDVEQLFRGANGQPGVFSQMAEVIAAYTQAGGLLSATRDRLDTQLATVGVRIDALEARLATRRLALQQEFIAADQAMTRLNSQIASLNHLGTQFRAF